MSIHPVQTTPVTSRAWASSGTATLCICLDRSLGFLIEQRANGIIDHIGTEPMMTAIPDATCQPLENAITIPISEAWL